MKLLCFFLLLGWHWGAQAYPEFIGIGYTTCLTCHFNGHGNGPLNDYGRALWSAEIASRQLTGTRTEEELAATSGFLGSKSDQIPWWVKPGAKMRALMMQTDPGGPSQTNRTILMQADINAAFLLDKKADMAFVVSYGYVPTPERLKNQKGEEEKNWISREHYFRWHASKPLWVYAGLTDKVYGIRNVNHTAYSRTMTGLAQNDQTHGVVFHYIKPDWELTLHPFIGNLSQKSDLRQKGISSLYEKEVGKDWRAGVSFLTSSNDYVNLERFGLHSRTGLGYGAAILAELGLIHNRSQQSGDSQLGYYFFSQLSQKVVRGYYLAFSAQAYKAEMEANRADSLKAGAGILAMPIARTEFRLDVENTRKFSPNSVTKESWLVMAQLHVSL